MNFQDVTQGLGILDQLTWEVVAWRAGIIIGATIVGLMVPVISAHRRRVTLSRALVVRSGASALQGSAFVVAICSVLHFADLRWLSPDQRGALHLGNSGGGWLNQLANLGGKVLNGLANVPAEWAAFNAAVRTIALCLVLAFAAWVVERLVGHAAKRAELRQAAEEVGAEQSCAIGELQATLAAVVQALEERGVRIRE